MLRHLALQALVVVVVALTLVATAPPADAARAQNGGPLGSVVVVRSEQHAYLYRPDGSLAARVPVSTGGPGHRTPAGTFRVFAKVRVGTASSDRRVHMDFFTKFNSGIGFHGQPWKNSRSNRIATPWGQRPVSHGCVRIPDAYAEWIYNSLPVGARVTVK